MKSKTLQEKLSNYRVNEETGCHEFICNNPTNVKFKHDGVCQTPHRWAYELYIGKLPEGKSVYHACDVTCCINPEHLFIDIRSRKFKDREAQLQRYIVNEKTGCHEWTGRRESWGHGVFKEVVDGKWRNTKAHRAAFEEYIGPLPEGCVVRHMCDVSSCINPDHLGMGSQADNIRDMKEAGKLIPPPRITGEQHYNCKVSDADVAKIRELLNSGLSDKIVAKMFNLKWRYIYKIKNNLIRKVKQ